MANDAKLYIARNQIVTPGKPARLYLPTGSGQFRDASAHYDLTLSVFLQAGINLASDTIKTRLVRTSAYTFSQTHDFLNDLPAAIVTDVTLGSKSISNGTFDAADAVFTAVPSGAAIDALVIYKDTGTGTTSNLIAYIDGFSVTPNGGDITIQWQATSPFIFKI